MQPKSQLTLGPVLFNWPVERWRDFYFRIADEAPLDTVYLGEVVCSKRLPFYAEHLPVVAERLMAAGKDVVFSTLALVMNKRELDQQRNLAQMTDTLIEANDLSAISALNGRPHIVGRHCRPLCPAWRPANCAAPRIAGRNDWHFG